MKTCFLIACFFGVSLATVGIDISSLWTLSELECAVNDGYDFAIVRCYCSSGKVDSNCATSVSRCWEAGFSHVDVYMFPCYSCGDGGSQVETLYDYLVDNDVTYGEVWLDIEIYAWSSSTSSNQAFFSSMVTEMKSIWGTSWGIYTNENNWDTIMGSSYTGGSAYQLWWAYWDEDCDSSFSSFGGWTKAAMQQYAGDVTLCSMDVDENCY